MAWLTTAMRIFLGLFLIVNGLNFWLHFLPLDRPPSDLANQLMDALITTGLIEMVKFVEMVAGLALLANRWVPLAMLVMTPLSVIIVWLDFVLIASPQTIIYGTLLMIPQAWLMLSLLHAYVPMMRARHAYAAPSLANFCAAVREIVS